MDNSSPVSSPGSSTNDNDLFAEPAMLFEGKLTLITTSSPYNPKDTMNPTNRFAIEPLSSFIESNTNPRTIFNPAKLAELADSIKATGVIQPILARPLPAARLDETSKLSPRPTLEIVAGARRFRGSKIAKAADIPAMIKDLTDDQVFEIQLIENLQRDDLSDLEAAEGYKKLMSHNKISPDEVAVKIGKSRSYVYSCLKLLDLPSFVKEVLRDELITSSAALLIARIPDIGLQQKARDFAITETDGHKPSIRAFQVWLRDNVMLNLSNAPFPIDVKTLTAAGSCKDCTTRTGHDPDLFADVKSDMCTHPPCYHLKAQAHKDALAAQVAAIPKASNRNVDEQQGLGLESTLAQDARANQSADKTADRMKSDIEAIKANFNTDIAKATRLATFDHLTDYMKTMTAQASEALLGANLMRAWLLKLVVWEDYDDVALMLNMPIQESYDQSFTDAAARRVDAATDSDLYVFAATYLLIEERNANGLNALKPATLMIGFAKDWGIDLHPIADEVREAAEEELKAKIAAINKQIKAKKGETSAPKTTSTQPPAGAANDDAAADAKKQKPAGASRKAKTTAQEAIAGIASAMQGIEAEPLDAALGGSEVAAIDSGKLAVGAKVKILDGKHSGKEAVVKIEIGSDMWSVEVGNMFSIYLPTKSLQVIA